LLSLLKEILHQNDRTNDRIKEKLTGSELQIYQYVLEKKIINNAEDAAKELNKSVITIQRGIKKLVELGLIERIGSNKTGYWKIK
jgi:ATP-dependent DNA helicase RecG